MIISASRRTDIPAFYSEWFMNRLREGSVMISNPYDSHKLGVVNLSPETVDCIVFWSKNPRNLMDKLPDISKMGYKYFFEYTITAYDNKIERNLPPKQELIETFQELSGITGTKGIDWRFDPIIISGRYTVEWHLEQFERLCEKLHAYTDRCIISFVDPYYHTNSCFKPVSEAELKAVGAGIGKIAKSYSLPVYTCAEEIDLEAYGIEHAACIDKAKIESVIGCVIESKRDKNQRAACRCMESIDIGAYDTCGHGCDYCYGTVNDKAAACRLKVHDVNSPLLTGYPRGDEVLTNRTKGSQKTSQLSMFDTVGELPEVFRL